MDKWLKKPVAKKHKHGEFSYFSYINYMTICVIFLGCVIQNQKIRCIVDTVLSSQKVVVSPLAVTLTGKTL